MCNRGGSNPIWHLNREGTAITGAYTVSTSEAAMISICSKNTTAHAQTHTESPHGPCLFYSTTPHQVKGSRGQGKSPAVSEKGGSDPKQRWRRGGGQTLLALTQAVHQQSRSLPWQDCHGLHAGLKPSTLPCSRAASLWSKGASAGNGRAHT